MKTALGYVIWIPAAAGFVLLPVLAFGGEPLDEAAWTKILIGEMQAAGENAVAGQVLPDGSIPDIVTDTHAWEVDWNRKWQEGIGQARLYGKLTGKKPGLILLMDSGRQEQFFYLRAAAACQPDIDLRTRFIGTLPAPDPVPDPPPDPVPTPDGKLQPDGLKYVYSFRVPRDRGFSIDIASSAGIAVNPATNTLYVSGKAYKVAEIEIPPPPEGVDDVASLPVSDLPIAEFVQQWGDPTGGIRGQYSAQVGQGVRLGGLLVYGDKLLWTIYPYYNEANCPSHGVSTLNLAEPQAKGAYLIGKMRPGHYGGYLALAPEGWPQPVITGQGTIPVVNRTSTGPSIHNFGPAILTGEPATLTSFDEGLAPEHAVSHLYYPLGENRFMPDLFYKGEPVNGYPNRPMGAVTTKETTLLIGYRGKGDYWYDGGSGPDGQSDPCSGNQGVHTEGREIVGWFYANAELLDPEKEPWEKRPYAVKVFDDHPRLVERQHWSLTKMVPCVAGSATHDPTRNLFYIAQAEGDRVSTSTAYQLIHVYQVR